MGRVYEYYCDYCRRKFGEDTHLNLMKIELALCVLDQEEGWHKKQMKNLSKELHFCAGGCLTNWLEERVKELANGSD